VGCRRRALRSITCPWCGVNPKPDRYKLLCPQCAHDRRRAKWHRFHLTRKPRAPKLIATTIPATEAIAVPLLEASADLMRRNERTGKRKRAGSLPSWPFPQIPLDVCIVCRQPLMERRRGGRDAYVHPACAGQRFAQTTCFFCGNVRGDPRHTSYLCAPCRVQRRKQVKRRNLASERNTEDWDEQRRDKRAELARAAIGKSERKASGDYGVDSQFLQIENVMPAESPDALHRRVVEEQRKGRLRETPSVGDLSDSEIAEAYGGETSP
jgi:hypothetical protein